VYVFSILSLLHLQNPFGLLGSSCSPDKDCLCSSQEQREELPGLALMVSTILIKHHRETFSLVVLQIRRRHFYRLHPTALRAAQFVPSKCTLQLAAGRKDGEIALIIPAHHVK